MTVQILTGDCREVMRSLPEDSVHCVVTSVPYWGLRAYGTEPQLWGADPDCDHQWGAETPGDRRRGQRGNSSILASRGVSGPQVAGRQADKGTFCQRCSAWRGEHGQEPSPSLWLAHEVEIWSEVRRVLRPDGVAWLNVGDSYATGANGRSAADTKAAGKDDRTFRDKPFSTAVEGLKPKDLCLMPERLAIALQEDGWWIRSRLPWIKRSAMPDSVKDRPGAAVEYWFMLTKSARYFFDMDAVRQVSVCDHPSGNGFARPQQLSRGGRGNPEQWQPQAARNFRNSDLALQSLEPPHGLMSSGANPLLLDCITQGYSEAHFATFPPKLIEPLIRASTSEKGCCAECGAPWLRIVERQGGTTGKGWHDHSNDPEKGHRTDDRVAANAWDNGDYKITAKGWRATCGCDAGKPVACCVLDPFGGAGTTGLVADRLDRNAILIELNPDYAEMARQRIQTDAPLFAKVTA